jgi:hypothetical protein
MMSGLTPTGFVVKTLPEIIDDINAAELALISPSLDVQPTAIIGIVNGIYAAAIYDLWLLVGAMYNGMDADQAVGDQLDGLALLTGTLRQPATATVVEGVQVVVAAGFSALAGTMYASVTGNTANLFFNLEDVNNPSGIPATITIDFLCQDTGPVQALANTLTVIAQPLSGWTSITNPDDGFVGQPIQNDSQLRATREEELSSAGNSTADAIASAVLLKMQPSALLPTTAATLSVTVLNNDTEVTDANGVPPHSIEVIARAEGATSGDDQLLCNLIQLEKAAGDGTYSGNNTYKLVTDSQGNVNKIYYTRPTDVALAVVVTVVVDEGLWPGDVAGKAAIALAMANYAEGNPATGELAAYKPGTTVYYKRLADQAFQVPGVVDWTSMTVNGFAANLFVDVRHVATLSTGGVTITVVPA